MPHPARGPVARRVGWRKFRTLAALLCLSFLLPVPSSQAQSLTARSLAARVDHHYNALHSLRVNFIQEYDGMGQHRRESGVLLLKKPGKMRWTYTEPAGKLFVLDGHDAFFYTPGQTEIERVPAKKLDDLRSPLRFLLGHSELAKEIPDLTIAPHGADFELSGVPKGMAQRIASLVFTLSPTGVIDAIRIEEPDGAVSRFTFSDEEPEPARTRFGFRLPRSAGNGGGGGTAAGVKQALIRCMTGMMKNGTYENQG